MTHYVHETPDISAAVERVREGLREHEAEYGVDPGALAALDSLVAHIEALEAALREIADGTRPFLGGTQNLSREELVLKARRALNEEKA